jgi:hypothetical protein
MFVGKYCNKIFNFYLFVYYEDVAIYVTKDVSKTFLFFFLFLYNHHHSNIQNQKCCFAVLHDRLESGCRVPTDGFFFLVFFGVCFASFLFFSFDVKNEKEPNAV